MLLNIEIALHTFLATDSRMWKQEHSLVSMAAVSFAVRKWCTDVVFGYTLFSGNQLE